MIEILGNKIILSRLDDNTLMAVNINNLQFFQFIGVENGKEKQRAIINLENLPETEILVKESFSEIKSAVWIYYQIEDLS